MGISGYFGHLLRKYKQNDIILSNIGMGNGKKNNLFLDFNGAIYTILKKYELTAEDEIIKNVLNYMDMLVSMVGNINLLYIAIDGSPPRAKIEQQRQRRFFNIRKKNDYATIKRKYNIEMKEEFDTNAITAGTQFMERLHTAISKHIAQIDGDSNIKIERIIYSSYKEPLEGEHKIIKYIKNTDIEGNIIIYGLDADLIMLSMLTRKKNIYMLREKMDLSKYGFTYENYDFLYLDIGQIKASILGDMPQVDAPNRDRIIDDYIFICFILGNDFIPHIPWLSIHNNGCNIILEAYNIIYNGKFIINDDKTINNEMLIQLFRYLSEMEDANMRKLLIKRNNFNIDLSMLSQYEREIKMLEYYPIYNKLEENRLLQYMEANESSGEWRKEYYNLCGSPSVSDYIKGLKWTFEYYYDDIRDWEWFNPNTYGVLCRDIYEYLLSNNINDIVFRKNNPIKLQTLLFMVMPLKLIIYYPLIYNVS